MRAVGKVGVNEPTLGHTFAHCEVEHRLLFAIVDTGDARIVALTVVGLHLANHLGRQVLERHLRVVAEEFLLVDEDLLNLLAIDFYSTLLRNLSARELLEQSLEVGAFGNAEGIGVVDERVCFHLHLRSTCRHLRFLEHLGIIVKNNLTKQHGFILLGQFELSPGCLVAHEGCAQQVLAYLHTRDTERTVALRLLAGHLCAVGVHNHYGSPGERPAFAVDYGAAYCYFLSAGGQREAQRK